MDKPENGSLPLVGRKRLSDPDRFGSETIQGYTGGNGFAWELVGEYEEVCPTVYDFKLEQNTKEHKKTKEDVDVLESTSKLPKSQNLIVLKDGSLLFTCSRSRIILKTPQS